jgi:hypothetical protein
MRLFVILIFAAACAHNSPAPSATAAPPPAETAPTSVDEVKLRACQSCQHDLEICRRRLDPSSSASTSSCVDDFMRCLSTQQLEQTQCAGMN